jgi:tRNA dimethylallyltransferase
VALAVAKACGGEIVGADAFQVYRGLDLLTAKPSPEELAEVPHHLIGTVEHSETFNVAVYLEKALDAIEAITSRGKLPVVVGGTGLYLRALTHGLADVPASDPKLRAKLDETPLKDLLTRLEELDPVAAANIDRQNPRRVVRALEVCLLSGKPFSSFRQQWDTSPTLHGAILERPREELYARIDQRTVAMFRAGVVEEVKQVLANQSLSATSSQVLGLREIEQLLRGELNETECISAIQQATRNYAKRQLTWFRKETTLPVVALIAAYDHSLNSIVQRASSVVAR